MIFAEILVEKDGLFITGLVTDFDGKAQINNLTPGEYNLTIKYVGYETLKTRVTVKLAKIIYLEYELKEIDVIIGPPLIRRPIIELDPYGGNQKIRTEQIIKMPAKP
jgi:hypothetical protein